MSFWKTGIRPLCAALMLLCAGSVYAASHQAALQSDDYVAVERKKRYSETEYAEEYTRRQDIVQRANQIFTLLGGEMALEKGEAGTALATYMLMLDRTRAGRSHLSEMAADRACARACAKTHDVGAQLGVWRHKICGR